MTHVPRALRAAVAVVFALAGALPRLAAAAPRDLPVSTLKNGLQIVLIENHNVPLVTIAITARNGGITQTPEFEGLPHVYEHMFFKANAVIPDQETWLARARELGLVWNGFTANEGVVYYFTLPAANLGAGIEFMKNAIRTPKFAPEELTKERQVVLGEYDRDEATPDFNLYIACEKLLFPTYYYRKNVIGLRDVIHACTVDKMTTLQHRYYIPNNCALTVAGDFQPAEALALVRRMFGDWKPGPDPFATPLPPHPPLDTNRFVLVTQPVENATVDVFWQGPSVNLDPRGSYVADVLGALCALKSGRFQRTLVESGLAASAELAYDTLKDTGEITASATFDPAEYDRLRKTLAAEIAAMATAGYFTAAELAQAKTGIEVSRLYRQEKSQDDALQIAYGWSLTGLDYYTHYLDNVNAVTLEDVRAFAAATLAARAYVFGLMVSPEQKEKLGIALPVDRMDSEEAHR